MVRLGTTSRPEMIAPADVEPAGSTTPIPEETQPMSEDSPKSVEEIPTQLITELAKSYTEVQIRLSRRNERGQVATVYNAIRMPTLDLLDIDGWANANAGGGRYRCEVKDPNDNTKLVMQPFHFNVEGPPRPPRFLGRPEAPMPMAGGHPDMSQQPYYPGAAPNPTIMPTNAPYAPPPTPWAQGLAGPNQQGYQPVPYVARTSLPPGATVASDEIALRQLNEFKTELAQTRSRFETQLERMAEENARLKMEIAARERQVEAERHNAQLRALEAKIEAMSNRPSTPESSVKDYAPVLAAVAPVLQAMMTSRASEASEGLRAQAQVLQTMATAAKPAGNDGMVELLKVLAPMVLPLFTDSLKQRGPEAQAALFQSMAESNLNNVAMMAQLIEAFASAGGGKEEPWWLPMIKEALGGVVGVAQAYTQQPGGLPGQRPLPPKPQGALAGYSTVTQPQQPAAPATQAGPAKPSVAAPPKVAPQLELMFQLLPGDYQSPEWRWILSALHADPPVAVENVAAKLTSHLEHLAGFDMLPPGLETLREHPRQTLETLLERLPIAQREPAYARQVLDQVLAFLAEDGFVQATEQAEVEGEEAAEQAEDAEPVRGQVINLHEAVPS